MTPDSSHADMSATEKRLSSRLTFVDKFVFPTAWLVVWGLGTLLRVLHPSGEGPPLPIFVAALAFLSVFFWRWGFTIKRVVATRSGLRVLFADHPAATFLLERAGAASRQDT